MTKGSSKAVRRRQSYRCSRTVVDEEKAWAKYLFKDGSIIGLNEKLLGNYVEWIANKRLRALGYDAYTIMSGHRNPLPWTTHWLSSRGMQVAPQETEIESYIIGGIKQDVKKGQFSKFKL
jgi:ribonucleotide reductase beta subunit family protein with ferritin-like domain